MKKGKWILVLLLIAALAVGLAACGGDSEEAIQSTEGAGASEKEESSSSSQQEPATPTEAPPATAPTDTPEPEPTDSPEPEPLPEDVELDLGSVGLPEDLFSYRSRMRMIITDTDAEAEEGALEVLVEFVREPLTQHVVISGGDSDPAGEAGGMEMYRVEDTIYMKLGEGWISTPSDDDILDESGFLDPEDMLGDTCGWKHKGKSDYNGIDAEHWTLRWEDLRDCMVGEEWTDFGNITDASGELYVARGGNYIAYMELILEGQNLDMAMGGEEGTMKQGRMEFTYEMSDVNTPMTIEVPEEALASSKLPEDIPIPEGAEEVSFMFGMLTFNSASSPTEVADFYKAQMPEHGWSESNVSELGDMYMLEYTKDGRSASLIISTDTDTGKTSVLITVPEDGS
ncbi:MAG: hypothetical protein ACP5JJ_08610 [Anaerolineae bacterium]